VASIPQASRADQALQLKQSRDNASAELLSTAELEALGDPFFEIVLRNHADVASLSDIENLLQPAQEKRRLFVVDENIANPARGQSRRAVIAFKGTSPNTDIVLDGNVMISVFFDSERFPDQLPAIEVWGWDNHRGRYNYYKMDRSGTPGLQATWKFRSSSVDADLLNPIERRGTCLHCHVNGAPIMKELAFPWNNWRSFKFSASYMTQDWPVKSAPRLQTLGGAEQLETEFILGAIRQFNLRRLNSALLRRDDDGNVKIDSNGNARIVEGRRLLKHLFVTTEVNLISSGELSGMHPFAANETGAPPGPVAVPATFFLNANLIAGGGPTNYRGLGIGEARNFQKIAVIDPEEYKNLINQVGVRLGGRAGDANFAWFVAEPSHVDNSMVDRLMTRGVLTSEFVAAVLAIDVERPVFSNKRASLLRFIPNVFPFKPPGALETSPNAPESSALTQLVIQKLRTSNPTSDSVEAEFLSLLEDSNPVEVLRERVRQYLTRVSSRLRNANTREDELMHLYLKAIEMRQELKRHPVLGALDETGNRLLPLP